MYCSGPPTKIWVWYATVCAPRAFWLVACLQPPPRAQGVTGPPYKGPGSIPPKRCPMITHLFTGLVPRIMRTITSQRGLWWEPRAVRAFGGGSPVREVGTSSCWAPPPSRQPWRGSAAPCHGRLGAWELHPLALGRQSAGGGPPPTWTVARGRGLPARWLLDLGALPHHCDALEVRTPDRSSPVRT